MISDNNNLKNSEQKFEFANKSDIHFDQKFETKPIGYFQDAFIRFSKNKGSVVAAIILLLLFAFAIFVPIFSNYSIEDSYPQYQYVLPSNPLFKGTGFWDGTKRVTKTYKDFTYDNARGAVVEIYDSYEENEVDPETGEETGVSMLYYDYRYDSYVRGFLFVTIEEEELNKLKAYEIENDIQVRYPLIDTSYTKNTRLLNMHKDANYYYKMSITKNVVSPLFDESGDIIPAYKTDSSGDYVYETFNGDNYRLRVNYDKYFVFKYGFTPNYIFGSDDLGRDIFTRLAIGARLSIGLGFSVSLINIIIGVFYGAIEGYYGGAVDLIMERISDILSEIPSIILLTLFQIHLAEKVGPVPSLIFAFVLTGWIGTAARVRMQVYRYKRQEYVLAARTLGAKDGRIIFRHILPNAIGTIITGSILMVPSIIFSESTLSFLGIVDLTGSKMTSIGAMLNAGQAQLAYYPHAIFFPALFISLLMISFNVFGNGLRDAFNPSLRGVE